MTNFFQWLSSLFKKPVVIQPTYPSALSPMEPFPTTPLSELKRPQDTSSVLSAVITRSNLSNKETMGRLVVTSTGQITTVWSCDTLELPYIDNKTNISCIPTGTYQCMIQPFHATEMYELQNVPGRFAVFIHNGNYATGNKVDTEGCILLGSAFSDINADGQQDVINSDNTVEAFKTFTMGKPFTLTIK